MTLIPILDFAYLLGFRLYDWQCKILLRYEAGDWTAVAACNFSGKTNVVFVVAALWTLYCFPKARLMYMSATFDQVTNQFFAGLSRFCEHRFFTGWQWLESEVRTSEGGFLYGRSSDQSGHIEGVHNQVGSPAGLLIDEVKTISDEILDTLERCVVTFRLYMSSTGRASGGFHRLLTARSHLCKTFRISSGMCPHIAAAEIEADRENLKDSVFRIKHAAEWLYDAGDAMISLEHVRALLDDPPARVAGKVSAFCDFAGPGDQSVLALCEGNVVRVVDAWVHRDRMHSTGKFLSLFRKLGLKGYQIGGDECYGHQLMDRMAEEGYHLKRINNGSPASKPNLYCNLAAEWWSVFGEKVEHREIVLPADEKLVAQLTSRRKLYDSKGRERLESKADMRLRGLESPDLADAVIGAVMLNQPVGGGITKRDLAGIVFGGVGPRLFSGELIRFGEEPPPQRVIDVSMVGRYPFNSR